MYVAYNFRIQFHIFFSFSSCRMLKLNAIKLSIKMVPLQLVLESNNWEKILQNPNSAMKLWMMQVSKIHKILKKSAIYFLKNLFGNSSLERWMIFLNEYFFPLQLKPSWKSRLWTTSTSIFIWLHSLLILGNKPEVLLVELLMIKRKILD